MEILGFFEAEASSGILHSTKSSVLCGVPEEMDSALWDLLPLEISVVRLNLSCVLLSSVSQP